MLTVRRTNTLTVMSPKALIFSSDQETSRLLNQALIEFGFDVESCVEIFAAVEKLTSRGFELIVADWDDGVEASFLLKTARELKANTEAFMSVAELNNPTTLLPKLTLVPKSEDDQQSSRVDDSRLIRLAQQGDTQAFEELVRQYDRAVLRLAIHLTGSLEDGQDIYQEAFLRAYVNLKNFRFECSFYTWIYRIVTNLCLDHLRKKHSRM